MNQKDIFINNCHRFYDMSFRSNDLDYLIVKLTNLLKTYSNKFKIVKRDTFLRVFIYWDTFV